jgi:alpha-amylase/alpha-mannosidase (GH57 family)
MRRSTLALAFIFLLVVEGFVLSIATPSSAATAAVRMSVSTDRYAYPLQGSVIVTIMISNLQLGTLSGLSINSTVYDSTNKAVLALPLLSGLKIGPLATATFNATASYSLSDENYVIVSNSIVNGTEVGSANVPFVVLDTSGKAPLTLAMVFHMHQPIYLNLQDQFEQPWVQVHSGSDFENNGTWYGSYFWHVIMLDTHPGIHVTFNLQPSLLYQWNVSMTDFKYNSTFSAYPGGQAELQRDLAAVNATVAGYRRLAAAGQAEILTSPFYHPLSAILVQLGLSSDLLAQIELGKNYTDQFMGVQAQGMWTPEMGFTMGMVPIMQEAGIKYTVLDGQYHFSGASGPGSSESMYRPFELDGANGSHVVVFFRDTQISTDLTSVWNFIPNPRVAASDFIAAVADVYRSNPGGVLTIASDGENPIAQGDELISALDFNAIYGAIQSSQSWLQTSTLGSIVANRTVSAKLTFVPANSWSGGFGLWIGNPSKTAIWEAIISARKTLVNLTSQYGANNPEIKKLWNYLYVAEGSDWEWQTPTGPAWFAMQGYRYAAAASQYVAPTVSVTSQASPYPLYAAVSASVAIIAAAVLMVWRKRKH